ncbi:hypothetical protein B0H16DRAFT_1715865 [Mycena metata]|uniref:MFS transporter n=1 Tax=Mycena metata TaxID=1033252 RepID=A0AAD7JS80_9AGAR|nr:hypothetical protein B0H16DRAFT_1715865 [Mycena metata]
MIILANTVPMERRPLYVGLIGAVFGVASVLCPLLGGAFTDKVGDGASTSISPIGAVTLVVIVLFFHLPPPIQIWKQDLATVSPRIIKKRSIWSGTLFALCLGCSVLSLDDIPTGATLIMFAQTLGGALFVSAGATTLRNAVDPQYLSAVLSTYNDALVGTFYVSTAMACLSLVGALVIEWRSVKDKKIELAVA